MKTLLLLCLTLSTYSFGQVFQVSDTVTFIGDHGSGMWADIDNDANQDFIVVIKDQSDAYRALRVSYGNSTVDTLNIGQITNGHFYLSDMNNDNKLDFIHHGVADGVEGSVVSYQTGFLEFVDSHLIDSTVFDQVTTADLNNDGLKEVILANESSFKIRTTNESGRWVDYTVRDLMSIQDFLVYDADNDGWNDILKFSDQKQIFLKNVRGRLEQMDTIINDGDSIRSWEGDFNNDGYFDLVTAAKSSEGLYEISLTLRDTVLLLENDIDLKIFEAFCADFNSDGLADVLLVGINSKKESYRKIYFNSTEQTFSIESEVLNLNYHQLTVSDLDYDGDLDHGILTINGDSLQLINFDNVTPQENFGPSIPEGHSAFSVRGGVIISWDESNDDWTPSKSITYDVFVGSSSFTSEQLSANFDLQNVKRLLTKRGNAGFREEIFVTGLEPGNYFYGIQAIDNSLYYLGCKGSETFPECDGRAVACGTFSYCDVTNFELVEACPNSEIRLIQDDPVYWYSHNKGFLGHMDTLNYLIADVDTIYFNSQDVACNELKGYVIQPSDLPDVIFDKSDTTICLGQELSFNYATVYDSLQWTVNNEDIVEGESFSFAPEGDGVLVVQAYSNSCSTIDTLNYKVRDFLLELSEDVVIGKGESIQLMASGAVEYRWQPEDLLNDPNSSDPIASPTATTRFTVEGIDQYGCVSTGSILVIVVDQGWIPNLFTPNNDGQNDRLLIYGLERVDDFKLSIYNRSGILVYESDEVSEAVTTGWDGSTNGLDQPNGIYYWKVYGYLDDGSPLRLNDKESGVIYLMR